MNLVNKMIRAAKLDVQLYEEVEKDIGVTIFKHTSDMGELLRCLGFAYSPNVLSILGIIPGIGIVIRLIASIWTLVAVVIAARQALDCGTGRAILISVLGFIAFGIVFILFLRLSAL